MTEVRLPRSINPFRMAEAAVELTGFCEITEFRRLPEFIIGAETPVEIHLKIYKDREQRVILQGRLKVKLILSCQRCLQPLIYGIDEKFYLCAVTTIEQAKELPIDLEPLLMEEEQVEMIQLIEDEILLALPQVPKHLDASQCNFMMKNKNLTNNFKKDNPFSKLAVLKKQRPV